MIYNIYKCLFDLRSSDGLFVNFRLIGKEICLSFSDDIRFYNTIPEL